MHRSGCHIGSRGFRSLDSAHLPLQLMPPTGSSQSLGVRHFTAIASASQHTSLLWQSRLPLQHRTSRIAAQLQAKQQAAAEGSQAELARLQ